MLPIANCSCKGRLEPFGAVLWKCDACGAYFMNTPRLCCVQAGYGYTPATDGDKSSVSWIGPQAQEYKNRMATMEEEAC